MATKCYALVALGEARSGESGEVVLGNLKSSSSDFSGSSASPDINAESWLEFSRKLRRSLF